MKLNKRQLKTLLCAMDDAISDRVSYLDSMKNEFGPGYMSGFGAIVKKTKGLIFKYGELREQAAKALRAKEAAFMLKNGLDNRAQDT